MEGRPKAIDGAPSRIDSSQWGRRIAAAIGEYVGVSPM
jgi:hypothetical protein